MLPKSSENLSQVDDTGPIELQLGDGSAPGRRKANHAQSVLAPLEVSFPTISTWMEKRSQNASRRVGCLGTDVFVVVTALA